MMRISTPSASRDGTFRDIAFLNNWIASLHVLSEGWTKIGLTDPAIDPLLTEAHTGTLRRYRNTAFHFQPDLDDQRIGALEADSEVF
jgi:hypothetical protein